MSPFTKEIDLYKLLELNKETATISDIKKAYRKLALQFHPDKQPQDASDEQKQEANENFQQLGMAYTVLSDPARKARYDKTGSMDESEFEGDKDWNAYFKELWAGVVSAETIEAQKQKYQGSEEEKRDVLKAYKTCKGKMGSILEIVECSTAKDGGRFEKIIREAIKEGTVPVFKGFEKSATPKEHEKRIKKELKEEQEFLKHQEKEKKEEKPSLLALIQKNAQNRQAKMNSIIESIEASSAGDKKGKRKREVKQVDDMPSEEEFLKLQEQLFKKQKK